MSAKTLPYGIADLSASPGLRTEAAKLLTGRDDVVSLEIHPKQSLPLAEGAYWERKSVIAKAKFSDGSDYRALFKEGWEGPLREATGIETAELLGLPLYEAVAGRDFLLLQRVGLRTAEWGEDLSSCAEAMGEAFPYLEFLGYSDLRWPNVALCSGRSVKFVDWGKVFTYIPSHSSEGYFLRPFEGDAEAASAFSRGRERGRGRLLESYSTAGTRQGIGELLEPMDRESYTDFWASPALRPGFPVGFPVNGRETVMKAKSEMERLAREWEAELK